MVFPLAAAITGGASLLGGLFSGAGAKSGGKSAARATLKANAENIKYQKQFAKRAIRWKVRDAKRAGLSPLAALGAQTVAFSPSSVGATQAGQGISAAAEAMGQGISRAGAAFGDIETRNNQYVTQLQKLQVDNMNLQNQKLASEIAVTTQAGQPPATPTNRWLVDGQGQTSLPKSPLIQDSPLKRVVSDPGRPHSEPGAVTDSGYLRTPTGYAPVMSTDAKERLEEDWIGGLTWNVRNRLLQNLQLYLNPPPAIKNGWYNPLRQEYQPGNDRADKSGDWFKKNSRGEWDFNW